MRRFALVVIAVTLLSGSVVQAASYQLTSAAIVDPILDTSGSTHSYSGNDLEPNATLINANLAFADLTNANLRYAYLGGANLDDANLDDANLTGADLTGVLLYNATLNDATFSTGTNLYDGQTVLQHGFDAAGLPGGISCLRQFRQQSNHCARTGQPLSVTVRSVTADTRQGLSGQAVARTITTQATRAGQPGGTEVEPVSQSPFLIY